MRFILIAFIAIVLSVHGEQKSTNPAGDQKQVQHVKEPTPSSPHIVVIEQEHPADQSNPANHHTENYLHELFSANNLPSILLFAAGLGGIAVGVYTLRDIRTQTRLLGEYVTATKDSTEAMRKSVGLQETQMRQWLDIEDLYVSCPHIIHGLGTVETETELTISFQIVNPTKMVLTLKEIMVRLFDDDPSVQSWSLDYTLPPENGYPVKTTVSITGEAYRKYAEEVFIIPITGLIRFEDAFETMRHHGFGFNCRCRPGQFDTAVYEGPIPKKGNTEQKGENPN